MTYTTHQKIGSAVFSSDTKLNVLFLPLDWVNLSDLSIGAGEIRPVNN